MSRSRRHFIAEQKAEVVRRHIIGKEAVSDLADELGVQPSQIYNWVKLVLDQADKAFQRTSGNRRAEQTKDRQIEQLRAKTSRQERGHLGAHGGERQGKKRV